MTLSKELTGIAQGARQPLIFKPLFGALQQNRYISLKHCPMTIPDATSSFNGTCGSSAATKSLQIQSSEIRAGIV